jgi:uncharacterized protein (DUF2141 family)
MCKEIKTQVLFTILLLLLFQALSAETVKVVMQGIKSSKGQMVLVVFKDNESFHSDKPFLELKFPKDNLLKGKMTVRFNLPPDTYGFCLYDDENENGTIDCYFLGFPKEGFAFSNYYYKGFMYPQFDSFMFNLNPQQELTINMKLRYI